MSKYVFIAMIILFITLYLCYGIYNKKKMLKRFASDYIDWDNTDYDYNQLQTIRKYWDRKNQRENLKFSVDDITWNDLDMDYVYLNMNVCQSSIGEEFLYAKLRNISFTEDTLIEFEKVMDFMDNHVETKAKSLYELNILGKKLHNNLYSYIYNIEGKQLSNAYIYYILMAIPIIISVACILKPEFIVLLVFAFGLNLFVYYKYKFRLEINLYSLSYISKTIYCAKKLSEFDFKDLDINKKLAENLKPLKKLVSLTSSLTQRAGTDLEMLTEYLKILFMWDFTNYNRTINTISKHIDEFHELYKIIGELDAAIAISEYRKHLDYYSKPQFTNISNIEYEEIYHPLINEPVSNSLNWNHNSIITGSNASGKSTFIKSLAINGICAQSINLCFAKSYKADMVYVVTSMAIEDNINKGESYFIAEIKSLKRIIDALNPQIKCICFIDEILRGTNTVERIASSAAMLNWLSKENCMVMVASHDIELTEILKDKYTNYHFREQFTDEGLVFDYKIKDGYAKTKNAIKLLEYIGFDNNIIQEANSLVNNFENDMIWKHL